MPFTSETARLAGLKTKRGVSTKTQRWNELQEKIVDNWATDVAKHMNKLKKEDMELFMVHYKDLLNYFKPRMQAQTIQSRSEILIKVVNPKDDQGNTIDITEEL